MAAEPVLFPMGREALAWVLKGGKPQRGRIGIAWRYRWHSFWFELNLRTLDARSSPEAALRPPVFILGMWRSGTTFLHDLLSTNRALLPTTTWQCMNSSIHALRPPPDPGKSVTRPMDRFSVSAVSPQEDEFAMLAQGIPSVYRAFFDPRRLGELEVWLNPQVWTDLPPQTWWPRWRRFLANVQGGQGRRLLLKSPNHTFRARAILRELPRSALVWMLRDPREVFFSNIKMWKAMFQRYALWNVPETTLDSQLNHFLESALLFSSQALAEAVSTLPENQLAVVRFDDLVERPAQVLERIHDRLGIEWSGVQPDALSQVIAHGGALERARYAGRPLPPAVQTMLGSLDEIYATAYQSHGV